MEPVLLLDTPSVRQLIGRMILMLVIARGSAQMLHIDVIFILFPVCRGLISLLRRTPLNSFIPFDKNITFHSEQTLAAMQSNCADHQSKSHGLSCSSPLCTQWRICATL